MHAMGCRPRLVRAMRAGRKRGWRRPAATRSPPATLARLSDALRSRLALRGPAAKSQGGRGTRRSAPEMAAESRRRSPRCRASHSTGDSRAARPRLALPHLRRSRAPGRGSSRAPLPRGRPAGPPWATRRRGRPLQGATCSLHPPPQAGRAPPDIPRARSLVSPLALQPAGGFPAPQLAALTGCSGGPPTSSVCGSGEHRSRRRCGRSSARRAQTRPRGRAPSRRRRAPRGVAC
mmetsp:Transcript_4995/g.14662  ORF Transcript_4995/g.14662 Transcript_4995/m.14662 type:complete len:234 (-) Transcript_4995:297-998(-)